MWASEESPRAPVSLGCPVCGVEWTCSLMLAKGASYSVGTVASTGPPAHLSGQTALPEDSVPEAGFPGHQRENRATSPSQPRAGPVWGGSAPLAWSHLPVPAWLEVSGVQGSPGQVPPGEEGGFSKVAAKDGQVWRGLAWPVPTLEVRWRGLEVAPTGRLPQDGGLGCVCWAWPTLCDQMTPTPTSAQSRGQANSSCQGGQGLQPSGPAAGQESIPSPPFPVDP